MVKNVWRKTLSEETKPLKIFIGWDSREDIAYQVARQSILDHASVPVEIIPLKQHEMRQNGLYWREVDKLAATEFTYTRYLIPKLTEYDGWALFIDCDFLFVEDVAKLFELKDDRYAIVCAQHVYTPPEGVKMDGKAQTQYPRKNWSSMMLINCAHPSNQVLTTELINDPEKTGAFFHRFSWLANDEIGAVSHEWNWLVNWYKEPENGKPKAIHYTEGGPWFKQYEDCEYNTEWYQVAYRYQQKEIERLVAELYLEKRQPVNLSDLPISDQKKKLIKNFMKHFVDPEGKVYGITKDDLLKEWDNIPLNKVAAIETSEIDLDKKNLLYDPILEKFVSGSNGIISTWDTEELKDTALIIRGLGGGSRRAIKHCWENGRTFYAIDTGYFGNKKIKQWHRITKNALQNLGPIVERPTDRLAMVKYSFKNFTPGRKILICPPSEKVMLLWDQPDPETWTTTVIEELKKYTDRPVEIRLKLPREARVTNSSIFKALANDVHCVVTYNSIAATEALLFGKPAIALGPNAAQVLCNQNLSEVENLNIPSKDEMTAFAAHLSYAQFTATEMENGTAWRILNGEV
jgi:lipopolysaccharide biosynthesis glycosyltransferase